VAFASSSVCRAFSVDAGEQFYFLHLKLSFAEVAFGLDLGLVLGADCIFFGLLLDNLIRQLLIFVLLVDESAHLRLTIEGDKQVTFVYTRSA
jgi:hypothetical protein